ncbi:TPA: Dot/Icm T4SS effector Lem6, partial [Legionella pneumophila]|nr:Dot/Icm T4SS effector Lem6 [Legionella pneumophila]
RTISKCVKLYERISGFPNLFAALSLSEQKAMISYVDLESKPTKFIRSFLSAAPTARSAVFEHLDLTKYYVNKISQYPIESVNFDDSIESVNKYKESVISELQKIKGHALAQKKYTQLDSAIIEKAFAEKLREVDALLRFGLFFKPQNIDLNQGLNVEPNQDLNIDLNQALNVEPDQELNIDPDQRIDLNQGIDINRYRALFSKPVNINPNQ